MRPSVSADAPDPVADVAVARARIDPTPLLLARDLEAAAGLDAPTADAGEAEAEVGPPQAARHRFWRRARGDSAR